MHLFYFPLLYSYNFIDESTWFNTANLWKYEYFPVAVKNIPCILRTLRLCGKKIRIIYMQQNTLCVKIYKYYYKNYKNFRVIRIRILEGHFCLKTHSLSTMLSFPYKMFIFLYLIKFINLIVLTRNTLDHTVNHMTGI